MGEQRRKVSYFYDADIGGFYYGPGHPMKPHRIRMAHNLILHYGLHNLMEVYQPRPATPEDLKTFHAEDYVDFLASVTPDKQDKMMDQLKKFSVGEDCPVFDGLYRYCQLYTGGSVGGAVKLNYGNADIVINWAGGLHHAKKAEASGFCYVNDIVLAVLELLKYHARVLYVDIDIHHGDGVEEAFLTTDRVMTVSFHKFGGGYFPGTGDIVNIGHGEGRGYAVNVPLRDGMTDQTYEFLFRPVMRRVMQVFQPQAIVFQSGADSLAGDRLGAFNLSMKGHAACLEFMKAFNVPMLVLGGGGYKINNVARCWAYETGRILGVEMEDALPDNEYREYFAPDYRLHIEVAGNRENLNTIEYLEKVKQRLLENLSRIATPGGAAFLDRPPDALSGEDGRVDEPAHASGRLWDGRPIDSDPTGSRFEHDYSGPGEESALRWGRGPKRERERGSSTLGPVLPPGPMRLGQAALASSRNASPPRPAAKAMFAKPPPRVELASREDRPFAANGNHTKATEATPAAQAQETGNTARRESRAAATLMDLG